MLAAEAVDELKASVAALKAQVDAQTVAASRLPLDGAKAADPARDAFVERYLRRGIDAGVEMKSLSGASGGDGGYETRRDFRHTQLRFRWRSGGVKPLDALHGPTLTIEGRDAAGSPRAWYVRLWNYAEGTAEDAVVSLDFDALDGGFLLPAEADPVWAGDIDRMFISLVPPTYDGGDGVLGAPAAGWVEMSDIAASGSGSVLAIGDAVMPELDPAKGGLGIASGYDDSYHLTPARLVRQMVQLGYRGDVVHYVGMSHYMRLEAAGGGFSASVAGGVLNAPCAAWHAGFAAACANAGLGVIWSLSYELFDAYCWDVWKQRASDGSPALTGWEPPSTLLSPANAAAMGYLQLVARAFVAIGAAAGLPLKFQVGEPWWWIASGGRICAYDAATVTALGAASIPIDDPALLTLPEALAGSAEGGAATLEWAPRGGTTLAEVDVPATGRALRPLTPVHGQVRADGAGGVTIGWVRRSRADAGWRDHVDQPLGESHEAWRIALSPPVPGIGPWESASPTLDIGAAELAALPPGCTIEIRQAGDFALSSPLSLPLT